METFESYPLSTVAISNAVSLATYGLGFYILLNLGIVIALVFLLGLIAFEFRLIRFHCPNCYYWGKMCGFGRGRISALLFKKGEPEKFCAKKIAWKDLVPDLLISLVPVIAGIIVVIIEFDLRRLLAVVGIILLSTTGTGYVRGTLTCKHCKQAETGCPAMEFFQRQKAKDKR